MDSLEASYTTIGTVEQKAATVKTVSVWDAGTKSYTNYRYPDYDVKLSEHLLNFDHANYLVKPIKRHYYGAYVPDYKTFLDDKKGSTSFDFYAVVEFSVPNDIVADHPVTVNIEKVLMGDIYGNKQLKICDHYQEFPQKLSANHTYIATLMPQESTHDSDAEADQEWIITGISPTSTQYDKNGNLIESEINKQAKPIEIVTPNFYDQGRGKYWLHMIESIQMFKKTIPVLPVDSFTVLPSFQSRKAVVTEGREINQAEFTEGKAVCVIPKEFADRNYMHVGSKIKLPLYYADYRNSAGASFGMGATVDYSLLNANGDIYPIFFEQEYTVVGIYDYKNTQGEQMAESSEMAFDLILIPSLSVSVSDKNNIADDGVMLHTTTSFQIPNGSIDDYENYFKQVKGHDLLELKFNDNGYTYMKKSLDKTRATAYLLFISGAFASFVVIISVYYFFIIKQKKRIAIERSLGMNKKQCRISILSGLGIMIFVSMLIGSGISATFIISAEDQKESISEYYNVKYSPNQAKTSAIFDEATGISNQEKALLFIAVPTIFSMITMTVGIYLTDKQFHQDIMVLFSNSE